MKLRSSNRILVGALAISLVVHVAVATAVHRIPPAQTQPEVPTRVEIVRVATPPPTPTPRPVLQRPPRPSSQRPAQKPAKNVAVTPPLTGSRRSGPTEPVTASTAGPSQPGNTVASTGPSAMPAPACSQPYVGAHAIDVVVPSAPDDAAGAQGTAEVQVSLDAAGRVTDAHIYHSTGSMILDRTAIDAARRSTYAPQIVDCQPAGGTYLFRVDFQD